MKKLVLLVGGLGLVAWGGPALTALLDTFAVGLFVLAAGLGVGVVGLALFWAAPFGHPRAALYEPPPGEPDEGPLQVPVLFYRSNGEVEWLLGELLPTPPR